MIPPILFKAKHAALWFWLGFMACMILSLGAKHLGWETVSVILSGGMLLFAVLFGGCVLLMFVLIFAAIIRFLIGGHRNV